MKETPYITEYRNNRRNRYIELYGGKCKSCGIISNDLQFHHINPAEKEFFIGRNWLCAIEKLERELAKCELLCGTCHKAKHLPEITHGTKRGYGRGCRCLACREAEYRYRKDKRDNASKEIPLEKHGTTTGYDSYKCRCDICRAAHAERARKQRAKNKR